MENTNTNSKDHAEAREVYSETWRKITYEGSPVKVQICNGKAILTGFSRYIVMQEVDCEDNEYKPGDIMLIDSKDDIAGYIEIN